jgi:hypothetical protein
MVADEGMTSMGYQGCRIIIDAGKVVGMKGETAVRMILSEDGGMLRAFPVK